MRILSLWQPWATLVVRGLKKFETRSWGTDYRGTILIHAAKEWNGELAQLCLTHPFQWALDLVHEISHLKHVSQFERGKQLKTFGLPFGQVIGQVTLKDIWPTTQIRDDEAVRTELGITYQELHFGDYREGRKAWRLICPCEYPEPIKWSGMQGLGKVRSDLQTLATIQLDGALDRSVDHGRG